jgi:hypothetical protein
VFALALLLFVLFGTARIIARFGVFLFCSCIWPALGAETIKSWASRARAMMKSEREVRLLYMIFTFLV